MQQQQQYTSHHHHQNPPQLSMRKSNQHSPTGPLTQTMTRIVPNLHASPQQINKDSMKSYFSNPNIHSSNMGPPPINVSSSHQGPFLGNTIGSMTPLNAGGTLGSSQHRTNIKMIQEHHQSMRKATGAEQQTIPAYSNSPKNIIVKTNKFLFKNVAAEPQRAPKGDLGTSGTHQLMST